MNLRLKQTLTITIGVVVAIGMLLLGLWQMSRFQLSAQEIAVEREAMDVVQLAEHIHPDGSIDDIYGRRVVARGSYVPEHEEVLGTTEARVATAFELVDGRYVAVVRGTVEEGVAPPPPPEGEQELRGIFLASDHDMERPQGSVRLQRLAQTWPSPLVAGYVTLPESDSAAQGLAKAVPELPEGEGTAMHQGYALQWWVFAFASIGFSIFLARGFGIAEEKRRERIAKRRAAMAQTAARTASDD